MLKTISYINGFFLGLVLLDALKNNINIWHLIGTFFIMLSILLDIYYSLKK